MDGIRGVPGKIREILFGRALRWMGREFAKGQAEAGLQPMLQGDLLAAIEAFAAELPQLGLGMGGLREVEPRARMAAAESRMGAAAAQVEDDELARRTEALIRECRRWTGGRTFGSREDFVAAADDVRARVRELSANK